MLAGLFFFADNKLEQASVHVEDISSSSESESSIDSQDNSNSGNSDADTSNNNNVETVAEFQAHDTLWKFKTPVLIDACKEAKYKPHLNHRHIEAMSEIDMWMCFFPCEEIDFILQCTNKNLRNKRRIITKAEFYKAIGFVYAMTVSNFRTRRTYWSTESGLFPAPAFGKRFGMGINRFEEILSCMAFSMIDEDDELEEDKWSLVRPFYQMSVNKWQDVFTPGYKITVDESMFAWYGKGLHGEKDGMPSVIKIARKPKGVGCECKTVADVQSGVMIGLEINEGKNVMSQKKWQRELGAGTATTLRLTSSWHGTGRIVIGDSWFASVKTACELYKRGLYFLGIVKTATRNYPMLEIKRRCPEERGGYTYATSTTDQNCRLISLAWRDKKIHTFIGSCGTTMEGSPALKRRLDEDGKKTIKEVKRPRLAEEYFEGAPAVDIHNHIRQSGLAVEAAWNTQKWHHRMFASLFGIIESNAFLSYKYFKKIDDIQHSEFTEKLAMQLINYEEHSNPEEPVPVTGQEPHVNFIREEVRNPGDHSLIALSAESEKKRVQRKCIICSRIRRVQQKASYRCLQCGPRAVLCAPTTGRNCFSYHIQKGIPA